MKKTMYLLLIACLPNIAFSQALDWVIQLDPKISITENAEDKIPRGHSITDADGNIYVTGHFSGTADFDPGAGTFNLTSKGGEDMFLCKFKNDRTLLWAIGIGDTENDAGGHLAFDPLEKNIYITGGFRGKVDFDPSAANTTLSSTGGSDIFVCKYTADGNFVFGKSLGGDNTDLGQWIGIDQSENIYLSGYFEGTADFDPAVTASNLTSVGTSDLFVSSLKANGDFNWAVRFNGGITDPGYIAINDIALSTVGELFLTGSLTNTVDLNPGAGSNNFNSAGESDIFILKLNSSGTYEWARVIGGESFDFASHISTVPSGELLITGTFLGTTTFDPPNNIILTSTSGGYSAFVWKIDKTGKTIWAKALDTKGSGNSTYGLDILPDPKGNVFSSGIFNNNIFLNPDAHEDSDLTLGEGGYISILNPNGNYLWGGVLKRLEFSTTPTSISNLGMDNKSNLYTIGSFGSKVDFDPDPAKEITLLSASSRDIFIARFSIPQALPVTFGPITSTWTEHGLSINWVTESETNNSHFYVEISKDGKKFVKAATVKSKHEDGYSASAASYSVIIHNDSILALSGVSLLIILILISLTFKHPTRKSLLAASVSLFAVCCITFISCKKSHEDILTKKNNTVFIRIAQVDKDGTTAYGRVIKVVKD